MRGLRSAAVLQNGELAANIVRTSQEDKEIGFEGEVDIGMRSYKLSS